MVHQHFMLVDNLSALDNIVLGVETSLLLKTAQLDARTKLTEAQTKLAKEREAYNIDATNQEVQRLFDSR